MFDKTLLKAQRIELQEVDKCDPPTTVEAVSAENLHLNYA